MLEHQNYKILYSPGLLSEHWNIVGVSEYLPVLCIVLDDYFQSFLISFFSVLVCLLLLHKSYVLTSFSCILLLAKSEILVFKIILICYSQIHPAFQQIPAHSTLELCL